MSNSRLSTVQPNTTQAQTEVTEGEEVLIDQQQRNSKL
jgi:hypothetical protein